MQFIELWGQWFNWWVRITMTLSSVLLATLLSWFTSSKLYPCTLVYLGLGLYLSSLNNNIKINWLPLISSLNIAHMFKARNFLGNNPNLFLYGNFYSIYLSFSLTSVKAVNRFVGVPIWETESSLINIRSSMLPVCKTRVS